MKPKVSMIVVDRTASGDPLRFKVEVEDDRSSDGTIHHVTMSEAAFKRLTTGYNTPENVVAAAFRFLLDREPKETILAKFDVMDIARYFPEFERELPDYLPKAT